MVSSHESFLWDDQWYPVVGVSSIDFLAAVRRGTVGSGAAAQVKPALQLAAVRTDRPDAGAAITAGTAATADGLSHYQESPSMAAKFWFRRGLSYKLTSGSYASCDVRLDTNFKQCGRVFSPAQVVVNPLNGTTDISFHPITPVFTANRADKAKAAVVIMDNANTALDWRLFGRVSTTRWLLGPGPRWASPGTSQLLGTRN